jgi:hypothetical protein
MRNLSRAVNVRRRGRSDISGEAAAGAETIVGLRPSSLSAPAAAKVLLFLIWGITTGCLSYAPKGKLPAGLCLIIIGTEGGALRYVFNAEASGANLAGTTNPVQVSLSIGDDAGLASVNAKF